MAKEILLTKGFIAIVDDEDYSYLSQFKWHSDEKGYARRTPRVNGKKTVIRMHRIIINCPDDMQVDHINGNKSDNRKENLRIVTSSQNAQNKIKRKGNYSSIFKGVNWSEKMNAWNCSLSCDNECVYQAYFINEESAANAYNYYASIYHGKYVKLNDVQLISNWDDFRLKHAKTTIKELIA